MIFPLGLGLKLRHSAYVTYLIVLLCVVTYFFLQSRSELNDSISKIEQFQNSKFPREKIAREFCLKYYAEKFNCDEFLFGNKNTNKDGMDLVVDILTNEIYTEFAESLKAKDEKITSLPAYLDYKKEIAPSEEEWRKIIKKFNLLSKDNISIFTVLFATFSHLNLIHLLGNMLVLIIFGRYVESTVGKKFYFVTYVLFGAMALWAYVLGVDNNRFVLGASANIFFVMGMFYVLFFNFKMEIYIWYFFIVSKRVSVNIKYFFPIFFLVQEIILSFGIEKGVAHRAHVYGLILGMVIAYIWKRRNPIPKNFLYLDEFEKWNEIKSDLNAERFLENSFELIKYNPYNMEIKKTMLKTIFENPNLEVKKEKYLNEILPHYIVENMKRHNMELIYRTLDYIHDGSYSKYFNLMNQKNILKILDDSIDKNKLFHSIRIIQIYFEKYPKSKKIMSLEKTLISILEHLYPRVEDATQLDIFLNEKISSRFISIVKNYKMKLETCNDEV